MTEDLQGASVSIFRTWGSHVAARCVVCAAVLIGDSHGRPTAKLTGACPGASNRQWMMAARQGDGSLGSVSRLERITVDPSICHGQPTVRGLRYPVESLLELLASGMTIDEIIEDYPDLERDDLLAALEFGALVSGQRRVVPLGAA